MYSYHAAGAMVKKRYQRRIQTVADLDATMAVDSEGRTTQLVYPNAGPTSNYTYDTLGRLSGMTDQLSNTVVSGVQ